MTLGALISIGAAATVGAAAEGCETLALAAGAAGDGRVTAACIGAVCTTAADFVVGAGAAFDFTGAASDAALAIFTGGPASTGRASATTADSGTALLAACVAGACATLAGAATGLSELVARSSTIAPTITLAAITPIPTPK